jgi:hypothetical protein
MRDLARALESGADALADAVVFAVDRPTGGAMTRGTVQAVDLENAVATVLADNTDAALPVRIAGTVAPSVGDQVWLRPNGSDLLLIGAPGTIAASPDDLAELQQALDSHAGATTGVHGIPDTAVLVVNTDPRLTNARTPTPHAASHATGGSDAIAPGAIGAATPADVSAAVATETAARTTADALLVPKATATQAGRLWRSTGAGTVAELAYPTRAGQRLVGATAGDPTWIDDEVWVGVEAMRALAVGANPAPTEADTGTDEWPALIFGAAADATAAFTQRWRSGWATVIVTVWWTLDTGAAAGNVRWSLGSVRKASGETLTGITTGNQTVAGPAVGTIQTTAFPAVTVDPTRTSLLRITRLGTAGADTAGDAALLGVQIVRAS